MNFFKQIWMILTLDCEGSARLSSDSLDRELRWHERWAVWFHCLICAKSRALDAQLIQLGKRLRQSDANLELEGLSDNAKLKILDRVDSADQD